MNNSMVISPVKLICSVLIY